MNAEAEAFRILVSHNPDYLIMNTKLFDLGLAGHTHAGQITLFGLWTPFLPMEHRDVMWKGRKRVEGADIIISGGLGTVGLPLRFYAPPEITVIELKAENS